MADGPYLRFDDENKMKYKYSDDHLTRKAYLKTHSK